MFLDVPGCSCMAEPGSTSKVWQCQFYSFEICVFFGFGYLGPRIGSTHLQSPQLRAQAEVRHLQLGPWFLLGAPWCPLHWLISSGVPSDYVKIAMENGHGNSEFTHEKWWFSIVMLNYQRVLRDISWSGWWKMIKNDRKCSRIWIILDPFAAF